MKKKTNQSEDVLNVENAKPTATGGCECGEACSCEPAQCQCSGCSCH